MALTHRTSVPRTDDWSHESSVKADVSPAWLAVRTNTKD
ncbi:hypothetical protein SFUMM280S_07481 [Streptomyces fumanus]